MINRIELVGKVLNQPELRQTKKGANVCNLTVLTWKYIPKKGESIDKENMIKLKTKHKIACWGNRAVKVVNVINKGDLVYIDGELTRRLLKKENEMGTFHFTFMEVKANLIKVINRNSDFTPSEDKSSNLINTEHNSYTVNGL